VLATLFSRKNRRTRKTGCLGKLPCHGDFLRHNALHEELRWIDGWVQEGLVASRRILGSGWARAFDAAPPSRLFAYRPETGRTLCVRFQPAFDKVGRRYPFLMFHIADAPSGKPGIASLVPALEPFFRRARDVADRGRSPAPRGEFLGRVEALNRPDASLFEPGRFDEWLETQTAADLFWRTLGDAGDPRRYALVAQVLEAAPGLFRRGASLRLPPCVHPGDAAFWIAAVEGRRRDEQHPFTLLWSRIEAVHCGNGAGRHPLARETGGSAAPIRAPPR
jgi:type VI secretion system protein ImpM